ncbi:hypothetical protein [Kangsaoukella pontilimi]|uniref:hypothetical protein n=1 Tax=Kangsaoukella pontilimi TaxID=2691042 RepID=UPI0013690702|nr:hypothetical protein [Kangsaoukella pontilimi]
MLPPPEFTRNEDGGLPMWSIAVLLLLALSVMFLRPVAPEHITLEEGLGPEVRIESL